MSIDSGMEKRNTPKPAKTLAEFYSGEKITEREVHQAKLIIDQQIATHAAGKKGGEALGMRLTGIGNYQDKSYIPVLTFDQPGLEPMALTSAPITPDQSQEISDHYFAKKKEILGE